MSGQRIAEFDVWREGYAEATVEVLDPGTRARMSLFYDAALTDPADNPQTLAVRIDADGRAFGKFERPIFVASDYLLLINSVDETAQVKLPLVDLVGVDASSAIAAPRSSGFSRSLRDLFSNRIYAADFGQLGVTPAQNTAVIQLAVGQAAAQGGGDVVLPAGATEFTQLTLPARVHLVGQGHDSTTLKSQVADKVITVGGVSTGLRDLTIDGVSLVAGSIGIYADDAEDLHLANVIVKRFETGIHQRGAKRNQFRDLLISNCSHGAKFHGDMNVAGGSTGGTFEGNSWIGGGVDTCLITGIELSYEDALCRGNAFSSLYIDSNTGNAIKLNGAQYTALRDCFWTGNISDLLIQDDAMASTEDAAKVQGVKIVGGVISGGSITLQDTLEDVIIEAVRIADVDFTLTSPAASVLLLNCTQDALVTISGDQTKLITFNETERGNVVGRTTSATVTKAWSSGRLDPGSIIHIEAVAIGFQSNGTNGACYRKQAKFRRPGSTLAYDAQTANFTVGEVVTGANSEATAIILADSDGGSTGTLTLRAIDGEFEDNEPISDPLGGAASVNGVLAHQAVAQIGSTESVGTDFEDVAGWDLTIAAVAQEAEVRVTGAASTTIDWIVDVRVVRSA